VLQEELNQMGSVEKTYLPAAGHDWALPLYDPLVRLLGIDTVRRVLLNQAAVRATHRVLDIGCGTGAMAILIKRLSPGTDVVGLDPDPKALARARHKAKRSGLSIPFDQGSSDNLPYPDASFDRVFSSFMFHHLQADERETTLCEVRRILKPGGSFHLVDFDGPANGSHGWLTRFFHSSQRMKDNSENRMLALMNRAGFQEAEKVLDGRLLFGALHIGYFQASAPTQREG
jgi:ubiquinone/menaquinone biosynthesis C-methylase UbiE